MGSGGEVAKGGKNLVQARLSHEGEANITQGGEILWALLRFGSAGIFAQAHVADPVQAVFDAPVAAIEGEQIGSGRALGGEAGDGVGDLGRHASLLLNDAFDAADLLETRPSEEFGQPRTGVQMPLGEAAMAFIDGAMFGELFLSLAFARGG